MFKHNEIHKTLVQWQRENKLFNSAVLEKLDSMLRLKKGHTMSPNDLALVGKLVDAINTCVLTETSQKAAIDQLTSSVADLTSQLGPIPPDVQASIDTALANAAAANPPATPV